MADKPWWAEGVKKDAVPAGVTAWRKATAKPAKKKTTKKKASE